MDPCACLLTIVVVDSSHVVAQVIWKFVLSVNWVEFVWIVGWQDMEQACWLVEILELQL